MFMVLSSWQSHCESSPGSFDECRTAPSGCRPKTKPDDLHCESACTGCQNLHPPSPFIIITQPESWYSFYRPTEGRRPSRPSWLVTYWDGLPVHRRSPNALPLSQTTNGSYEVARKTVCVVPVTFRFSLHAISPQFTAERRCRCSVQHRSIEMTKNVMYFAHNFQKCCRGDPQSSHLLYR